MSRGPSEVRRVDADGVVRVDQDRGRWWLPLAASALGAAAIALAWILSAPEGPSPGPPNEPEKVSAASAASPARARTAAVRVVPPGGSTDPEEEAFPKMATDTPPGGRSGIALFPAPGTKPIKRGIIVPDGFPLPPGYVRHYQYTDDGQALPAILMFHPDFKPVDSRGQPVPMPKDRVVPPELAPPGLPIQMLEPPKPAQEDGQGR